MSPKLLESLHSLIKSSLIANRPADANSYVDRALQITGLDKGLHDSAQYQLLKSSIQIELDKGNWKDAKEKLTYFEWLINTKYKGSAVDLVALLN